MKYYGVNLKGDLTRRTDFELLAPLLGEANKSYIQSLLDYREGNGARYYHSNVVDTIQGDVVTGRDDFFPGVPPTGEQIDIISLKGLIDGGNYWTSRTQLSEGRKNVPGFSQTENHGIIAGGFNGPQIRSAVTERYSNAENYWINRVKFTTPRSYAQTFTITSDLGLHYGGENAASVGLLTANTHRHSNAENSWTQRTTTVARSSGASLSLTQDLGLGAGGTNTTGYWNRVDSYANSADVWSSRTVLGTSRYYMRGISLTTDGGVVPGGYNGSDLTTNERYSYSSNAWTSRASMTLAKRGFGGLTSTTDSGLVACGTNGSYLGHTSRYNDSTNGWTERASESTGNHTYTGEFNLSNTTGILGGSVQSYGTTVSRFKDSSTNFDNQTISTYKHPNAAVPKTDENQYGENLVYNGDMELDDDTWIAFGSPVQTLRNSTYSVSGTYCWRFDCNGSNDGIRMADHKAFTTETGKTYKFSVYVRPPISSVYIQINRGGSGAYAATFQNLTINEWNLIEFEYEETSGGDNGLVYIVSGGSGTYNYFVDDVQVREVLETRDAKDVVFTEDLTNTTDQIKHIVVTSLNQKRDPVTMNGYWTFRNPMTPFRATEASFGLSDDVAIVAGGWISSAFNDTSKYIDSENAWVAKTDILTARSAFDGFRLDSNYGVAACGTTTGSNYTNITEKYSDPAGSWSSRTGANISRIYCRSFQITSDTGLMNCGNNGTQYIGNVERHSDSGNSWTNRTPTLDNVVSPGGFDLTTDLGIISGGYNNSSEYKTTIWRHSDSGNSWTNRTSMLNGKRQHQCFNLSSTTGLMAGGYNSSTMYFSELYDDSANSVSTRTDLSDPTRHGQGINISSTFGLVTGGYSGPAGSNINGNTQRYVNSEVASISAPTVDISLSGNDDESQEFDLKDQPLDTLIDLTGFTTPGGWTLRSSFSTPRYVGAGFELSTDLGVAAGGYDTSLGQVVDRYSDSQNAWYPRTNTTIVKAYTAGFGLTTNLAIVAGGWNASPLTNTERYNDTGNSWASRTGLTIPRGYNAGFKLTTDLGITAGGYNGNSPTYLNTVERYSDSGNTWSSRTALSNNTVSPAAFKLTENLGMISTGRTEGTWESKNELYSDSGNSWTNRATNAGIKNLHSGFNIDSDNGLTCGGKNGASGDGGIQQADQYTNSTDLWTSKEYPLFTGTGMFASALTAGNGVVSGGSQSNACQTYNSETTRPVVEPAGIWTLRANELDNVAWSTGAAINTDKGLRVGGHNGAYTNHTTKYTNSSDGWTQRTGLTTTLYGTVPFSILSQQVISASGRNSTGYTALTYRFVEGDNSWTSRTSMSNDRTFAGGFGLSTNQGIVSTGEGGGVSTERFTESSNSWASRTDIPEGTQNPVGFGLNSDKGMIHSGYLSGGGVISSAFVYSDSDNSWENKANSATPRYSASGFSLSGERGISGPGRGSSGTEPRNVVERFDNTTGLWSNRTTPDIFTFGYGSSEFNSGQQGVLSAGYYADTSSSDSAQRYTDGAIASIVDPAGYWTYRTDIGRRRYATTSFELTSNLGVTCAGNNGSGAQGVVDRYNDTDNTWESRTDLNTSRQDLAGWNMDSDQGIAAAGASGGYSGATERYSNSADSWTNRTSASFAASLSTGAKLTSDLGIKAGGTNGTTRDIVERFSDAGNAWTSRTALNETKEGPSGIGLTTDVSIVAAGHNGTSWSVLTDRYSDTGNTWTAVATKPASSQNCDAFKISDNLAITAGGKNSVRLSASDKFHNSENTWSVRSPMNHERSRVGEFSTGSSQGICCGGRDEPGVYVGTTERFTDTYTSEAVSPEYKLRLKFNLYRNIQGDSWTNRTSPIDARYAGEAAEITSGSGMISGGHNGSGLSSSEKYNDNNNNWTSRSSMLSTRWNFIAFPLNTDQSIVGGGSSGFQTGVEKFSDASDQWISRTALSYGIVACSSFSLNYDTGISAGGRNSSGTIGNTIRYNDSSNGWTSRGSLNTNRYDARGFSTTSDHGVVTGGYLSSHLDTVERFSESNNSWGYRSNYPSVISVYGTFELSGETGLVVCGIRTSGTNTEVSTTTQFYDTGNVWITRFDVQTRTQSSPCFSLTNDQGIKPGGFQNTTVMGTNERYTGGECAFSGFAVQTLK